MKAWIAFDEAISHTSKHKARGRNDEIGELPNSIDILRNIGKAYLSCLSTEIG